MIEIEKQLLELFAKMVAMNEGQAIADTDTSAEALAKFRFTNATKLVVDAAEAVRFARLGK